MKKSKLFNLSLTAMFIAVGLVLPFFTGQIPQIGKMLLPMHFPILLCGFICGWKYGLLAGFILPILRSLIFGMPMMFPVAISMSFELATYGSVVGILYQSFQKKDLLSIYVSLIGSMILGRIVWGITQMVLLDVFTWKLFMTSAFLNAILGIIMQLIIIPIIMMALNKSDFIQK